MLRGLGPGATLTASKSNFRRPHATTHPLWHRPEEFKTRGRGLEGAPEAEQTLPDSDGSDGDDDGSTDEDAGLPPLEKINNRRVVEYPVSSDSDSD